MADINVTLSRPVINVTTQATQGPSGVGLTSLVQTSLPSNFDASAGTDEQEVTSMRVSLPVMAGTYKVKVTLKLYLSTVSGNNSVRTRIGTSTNYLTNFTVDNLYVGVAKTIESLVGISTMTLNLSTQTYVSVTLQNDVDASGLSISASGTRSTIVTEIFN